MSSASVLAGIFEKDEPKMMIRRELSTAVRRLREKGYKVIADEDALHVSK
jgi:hypothetical protein